MSAPSPTGQLLGSVSKSGQTWSLILDTQGSGQALYVYNSVSTNTNGYLGYFGPDGSWNVGGSTYGPNGISSTGATITSSGITVNGTGVFNAANSSQVPITVNGAPSQAVDLLDVFISSGGTKAFWVDSAGAVHTNGTIYMGGGWFDGSTLTTTVGGLGLNAKSSSPNGVSINYNNSATGGLNVFDGGTTNKLALTTSGITANQTFLYLTGSNATNGGVVLNNSGNTNAIAYFQSQGTTQSYVYVDGSFRSGASIYGATSASVSGTLTATKVHANGRLESSNSSSDFHLGLYDTSGGSPNKYLRANGATGNLEFLNSAFTAVIATMNDNGGITAGNITSLASASASALTILSAKALSGNNDTFNTTLYRAASGGSWTTANWRLYRNVDATAMQFIDFPGQPGGGPIVFGSGPVGSSTNWLSMTNGTITAGNGWLFLNANNGSAGGIVALNYNAGANQSGGLRVYDGGTTNWAQLQSNALTFSGGASSYGMSSATITGTITIPNGTAVGQFTLGNQGTATATTTSYASNALVWNNSSWNGTSATTNWWTAQMGGGGNLNITYSSGGTGLLLQAGGLLLNQTATPYIRSNATGSVAAFQFDTYNASPPTGDLVDFLLNGVTKLQITNSGGIIAQGPVTTTGLTVNGAGTFADGSNNATIYSASVGTLGGIFLRSNGGVTVANGPFTTTYARITSAGLTLPAASTATSTNSYNSSQLILQNSIWSGSAAVSNAWSALVDTNNALYFRYNGTNTVYLATDGTINVGTAASSSFGPSNTVISGTLNVASSKFSIDLNGQATTTSAYKLTGTTHPWQIAFDSSDNLQFIYNSVVQATLSTSGAYNDVVAAGAASPAFSVAGGAIIMADPTNATFRANTATGIFQFQKSDGTSWATLNGSTLALTQGQAITTGSSTYGATSASVNGALSATSASFTNPLPVTSGGTGTGTPALVQGSNISITGSWPNQTIALVASPSVTAVTATNGLTTGSSTYGPTSATVNGLLTATGAKINVVGSGGTANTLQLFDTTTAAANPSKYLRVNSGALQICNSAFTAVPWQVDDAGNVTQSGSLTAGSVSGTQFNIRGNSNGQPFIGLDNTTTTSPGINFCTPAAAPTYGFRFFTNGTGTQLLQLLESGSTFNTPVTSTGLVSAGGGFNATNTTGYTLARGGNILITADTTNLVFRPNTSGGNYAFQNYAGTSNVLSIDQSGNTSTTGTITAPSFTANGVITSQNGTTNILRVFADAGGGQNWIESGNGTWTGNVDLNLSGYNGNIATNLNLKFSNVNTSGALTTAGIATFNGGSTWGFVGPGGGTATGSLQLGRDSSIIVAGIGGTLVAFAVQGAAWYAALDKSGNMGVAGSYYSASKSTLKRDIRPLEHQALDILREAQIVHFNYVHDPDDCGVRTGFLAEQTHPVLSGKNQEQYDYMAVGSVTIKAVQELEDYCKALEARLVELEARLRGAP